jgi:hypothetical protein
MKIDYLTGKYNGLATFYTLARAMDGPGAYTVGDWGPAGAVRSIVDFLQLVV